MLIVIERSERFDERRGNLATNNKTRLLLLTPHRYRNNRKMTPFIPGITELVHSMGVGMVEKTVVDIFIKIMLN